MASPIDDLYTTIISLSSRIADLPDGDPTRDKLERKRETLRGQAAAIALEGRHATSISREIEVIEHRLATIEAMLIREGYQEKRGGKNIQDPGAYSANINRLLAQQHENEVRTLTAQLERLRSRTDARDTE